MTLLVTAPLDTPCRPGHPGHMGMASLDGGLTVLATDAVFRSLFGRTAAEVCGRHLHDLLLPGTAGSLGRRFAELAEGGPDRFTDRVIGVPREGEPFRADLTGVSVHGSGQLPDAPAYLIALCPDDAPDPTAEHAPPPARTRTLLSPLDARILEGIAGGTSNLQLADRLYLSRQGVEYHVGRMLRQLRVTNRAALVARAHSLGMLAAGTWPPRVLPQFVKEPRTKSARTDRT
ncbi:LuxR C-terminal-related transcriptional regulator [Streptomyces sp. NPDC089919]|uniref:helix-turn-helix transcriptional regulator n=1 Tax=Streptomyces sp. NPDC089919 TaxID=3155188 RepID=UPI003419694D